MPETTAVIVASLTCGILGLVVGYLAGEPARTEEWTRGYDEGWVAGWDTAVDGMRKGTPYFRGDLPWSHPDANPKAVLDHAKRVHDAGGKRA